MAILALKNHYLGKNMVDSLASAAEKKLATLSYTGESRRWNFEKYASAHLEQHTILEDLSEQGQHAGIDEQTKVRPMLDGIKTPKLDTVKTTILGSHRLRNNFASAVNLYKDFIQSTATGGGNPSTGNATNSQSTMIDVLPLSRIGPGAQDSILS